MINIEIEVLLIKDSYKDKASNDKSSCIEVAKAELPDKSYNCNIGQQLIKNRITTHTTVSTFIVNQILNSAIQDCGKSTRVKRIYIICSNHIIRKSDTYSKKTIRYFIKKQKEKDDLFILLSKNPITLIRCKQLGIFTKFDFLFNTQRRKIYGKYS